MFLAAWGLSDEIELFFTTQQQQLHQRWTNQTKIKDIFPMGPGTFHQFC